MENKDTQPKENDELLSFADESEDFAPKEPEKEAWKILISDDEEEVHNITRMVLEDYAFEGIGLRFLSAFSADETIRLLQDNPDVAIVLLDVVMETDDAGLNAVKTIREDLNNHFVRIILRTGQPGKAPESQIITRYDINDYKEKTELTAQKMFTTITASLRAFRDLRIIDKNRKGLELIINSSGQLYASQKIKAFSEGVLNQLTSLLHLGESQDASRKSGFAVTRQDDKFMIIAATGEYENTVDTYVKDSMPSEILEQLKNVYTSKTSIFVDDTFVGFFQTETKMINLIYLNGCANLSDLDKDLITIFSTNVGVAYDNISLNQEIIDTQKEIIETLGGIVETRSKETANHVLRVAEYAYQLATDFGLPESQANLLRLSAPMHDVGKIGIPDAILNKPGNLTEQEFELIKSHTSIGYEILRKSKRKILKTAAILALQHHEYWNGKGYPSGLKGEEIHIYSRITGILDVFDALSCKRSYKEVWTVDKVYSFIRDQRGKQFDPALVDIFLNNIEKYEKIKEMYPDD